MVDIHPPFHPDHSLSQAYTHTQIPAPTHSCINVIRTHVHLHPPTPQHTHTQSHTCTHVHSCVHGHIAPSYPQISQRTFKTFDNSIFETSIVKQTSSEIIIYSPSYANSCSHTPYSYILKFSLYTYLYAINFKRDTV